jgi:hypothetical protein
MDAEKEPPKPFEEPAKRVYHFLAFLLIMRLLGSPEEGGIMPP